jgi:hypothetical protein
VVLGSDGWGSEVVDEVLEIDTFHAGDTVDGRHSSAHPLAKLRSCHVRENWAQGIGPVTCPLWPPMGPAREASSGSGGRA